MRSSKPRIAQYTRSLVSITVGVWNLLLTNTLWLVLRKKLYQNFNELNITENTSWGEREHTLFDKRRFV